MKAPKILCLVGRSGSGKTTLVTRLLPLLVQKGLKVGSIKHSSHHHPVDQPGKDSYRHRQAGASRTLLLSGSELARFEPRPPEQSLQELVREHFMGFDLVISEGFKQEEAFKVEVARQATGKPPLFLDPAFADLKAVYGDVAPLAPLPFFGLDQITPLLDWLCQALELEPANS